jgi:predicted RNA-binding protein YlxR (DUF448 family)
MGNKEYPVRMCIACRCRMPQSKLIRLQRAEDGIVPYSGSGRSLYICSACSRDGKRIKNISKRLGVEVEAFANMLKEFDTDG